MHDHPNKKKNDTHDDDGIHLQMHLSLFRCGIKLLTSHAQRPCIQTNMHPFRESYNAGRLPVIVVGSSGVCVECSMSLFTMSQSRLKQIYKPVYMFLMLQI